MHSVSTLSMNGGRPRGGPRFISTGAALLVLLSAAACGGQREGPETPRPTRGQAFSRPLEIYHELGFMTGPAQFPAVAALRTMAGPGDSTLVLVGMSLPSSALRFQREGNAGFFAEYLLNLTFLDSDSSVVRELSAREVIRVAAFAETGRTDESVIFQKGIAVLPGRYVVQLQAADANSSRGFSAIDTLDVPAYGPNTVSEPVLVYQAAGRGERDSLPQLIPNPRNTVAYGGESPLLYLESYGSRPLTVRVSSEEGDTLWEAAVTLNDGAGLQYGVVEIPSEQLPLGRLWVEVASEGTQLSRTPLVLTISDQWMVANFEEVLQFLRYIAYPEELDSLSTGTAPERRAAWERFWERRDPMPVTPINEYRDAFFQRVRYATDAFREVGGRAGWNTDRGEVYIVLGGPDYAMERWVGNVTSTDEPNAEEWIYANVPGGRLSLLFHDRNGFGRYELIPQSQSAFRAVAERMKRARPAAN